MSDQMDQKDFDKDQQGHANLDPITKQPGAHPIGVGVGAAAGGIAGGIAAGVAAGAAAGTVAGTVAAGPIGTAIGAAVGAIVGGLGGKAVAEKIDPTVESAYWRENHAKQPYAAGRDEFSRYQPAYQTGWEGRAKAVDADFDSAEPALSQHYGALRGDSTLDWTEARPAARAAWDRAGSGTA